MRVTIVVPVVVPVVVPFVVPVVMPFVPVPIVPVLLFQVEAAVAVLWKGAVAIIVAELH
jgi:hypothetical protein